MPSEPSLSDVIKAHVKYALADVHTCIPGRIINYNPATQKADVQPLIKKEYRDGQTISPAAISGAPVVFPAGGTGSLSTPIKKGDPVLLLFSERSIDLWVHSSADEKGQAREISPQDNRKHALSDVICIPGIYPFGMAPGGHPTNVVLRMNAGVNNANNAGENSVHLHPVGDTEAVVLYANRYTDQLSTVKQLQDGSIKITSDEGNSLTSTVHLRPDGVIHIDSGDGTNIEVRQGASIVINSSADTVVNAGGNVTVTGGTISLNSGSPVVTTNDVDPFTGQPHPEGSPSVTAE